MKIFLIHLNKIRFLVLLSRMTCYKIFMLVFCLQSVGRDRKYFGALLFGIKHLTTFHFLSFRDNKELRTSQAKQSMESSKGVLNDKSIKNKAERDR